MRKKGLVVLGLAMAASLSLPLLSYAGEWKEDNIGKWYQNDDGTYPSNTWKEINGKSYYFNDEGYMLCNAVTPDGKRVGEDGLLLEQSVNLMATDNVVAKAIVEDMGLSYAALKGKYGDYELGLERKGNDDYFEQDYVTDVVFDDNKVVSSLLRDDYDVTVKYLESLGQNNNHKGKKVFFTNSPVKLYTLPNSIEELRGISYRPNYIFATDDTWNVLEDGKPVMLEVDVRIIFPQLGENYELNALETEIKNIGATDVVTSDKTSSYFNPWDNHTYERRQTSVDFYLGGYKCHATSITSSPVVIEVYGN